MRLWPIASRLFAGLGLAGMIGPAWAECRIALALAVDVSRSINAGDYRIQRAGLMAALADPAVRAAFLTPDDHVALAVYEWSGRDDQTTIIGWSDIRDAGDLDALATIIGAHEQPLTSLPTALGWALDYGLRLFETAPLCDRRVLDVSGDGRNNDGIDPAAAFARRDYGDLVINALAIGQHESDIARYYEAEVIRGPGAFVEVARRQQDFPAAIRRKLIRELTDQVSAIPALMPRSDG